MYHVRPVMHRRRPILLSGSDDEAISLLTGLVAYWKLDELLGSDTRVDSHASNDLSPVNDPTGTGGKLNNAVVMAAASSMALTIADNADLSMGDIDFSIACWLNLSSKSANMCALCKGENVGSNFEYKIEYATATDRFGFFIGEPGSAGSTFVAANSLGDVSTSTWYFVLCRHNAAADTISIQVNNGTVDSAAWSGGSYNSALMFALGRRGTSTAIYWDGMIDEVGIWKKVLSAAEGTALYNGGSALPYSSFT